MRQKTNQRRDAFTLIELLVVIAIIAVLAALGTGAYFSMVNVSRRNNTVTNIQNIHNIAMKHWQAVADDARKEEVPSSIAAYFGLGADPMSQEVAKVIWVKLRLMEAFPTSFKEIAYPDVYFWPYQPSLLAPSGLIPKGKRKYLASYKALLPNGMIPTPPLPAPAVGPTESSACLLIALSVEHGGVKKIDRDSLGAAQVYDTNGDGLDEIVDGWKNPYVFFRFPAGSADLQANNPNKSGKAARYCDPYDKEGALIMWSPSLLFVPKKAEFESYVHRIAAAPGQACYVTPVLVSAGKDGQLGLNADLSVGNASDESDNLYSYKLRQ